ncbi:ROK family protein [Streptomyces calidiresistens]|uniref:ROK family protein n=1 Tax=Streptomyces calidiresistens TaxID=1485586 RepID=A0A7W3T0U4_9ACTN|nr:ROK family protein [Streptomyces calidiresistens]
MRLRNLSRVLHLLADDGPLSRAEVAARTGLTRAAISSLVDELLRAGLVVESSRDRSGSVGRPGTALEPADRGPCGIGAEIGVDQLAVCAMDLRGGVRLRLDSPMTAGDTRPGRVLAALAELLEELVGRCEGLGLRPAGVTVAVPGLVARDSTTVVRAPNLGWEGVDPAPLLPTGHGPLRVENEANLGAVAERAASPAGTGRDLLYVSAGIGIGAAVLVDGELLRGARGFAGELGHVPVAPDGPPCRCGSTGCAETLAGEEAVLRAAGTDPGEGPRAPLLEAVRARCEGGDERALAAVERAGRALGVALSAAVNLLDPAEVVIGGPLARLGHRLLPALEHEVGLRTAVAGHDRPAPPLRLSRLGPDGPLLGAARTAVRGVLDDPGRARDT